MKIKHHTILLIFLAGFATSALAQPVQIRVESPRPIPHPDMSMPVTITDDDGDPFVGLRKENVGLRLDGQTVPLENMYTAFADSARLGVIFAVDRSGSMGDEYLRAVRNAIQEISETFAPYDQVGLVTFDSDVRVKVPPTTSLDEFNKAVRVIREGSDTALHDAVQRGSELLESVEADRRALVVFSDGRDTKSALSAQNVAQTLQSVDWPVYTFGLGEKVEPRSLRQFASVTDGQYNENINRSTLSSLYTQLTRPLEGLHYVLQFSVDGALPRAMHRLEIEVRYRGTPYSAGTLFSDGLVPR